jgi:hypothetical protein
MTFEVARGSAWLEVELGVQPPTLACKSSVPLRQVE